MAERSYQSEPVIKILALGDSGVGKSSLLNYFTDGVFSPSFASTVGVDFKDKKLVRRRRKRPLKNDSTDNQSEDGSNVPNVDVLETDEENESNQTEWREDFGEESPSFDTPLDQSQWFEERVHLQLWDTSGQERFRSLTTTFFRDAMGFLLTFDLTHAPSLTNINTWLQQLHAHAYNEDPALVLVGSKCDLIGERKVDGRSGENLAESLGVGYYETSALTGHRVCEAVYHLVDVILKKKEENTMKSRRRSVMDEHTNGRGKIMVSKRADEEKFPESICTC